MIHKATVQSILQSIYAICFAFGILQTNGISQTLDLDTVYLRFETIDTRDGLTVGYTTNVIEDSLQYIWIGTQAGLNRYDGHNIEQFTHDPSNKYSLIDKVSYPKFVDSYNRIWNASTENKYSIYDPKETKFFPTNFPINYSTVKDAKGYIWNFWEGNYQVFNEKDIYNERDTLKVKLENIHTINSLYSKNEIIGEHRRSKPIQIIDSTLITVTPNQIYVQTINYTNLSISTKVKISLPKSYNPKFWNRNFIVNPENKQLYIFDKFQYLVYSIEDGSLKASVSYPQNIINVEPLIIDIDDKIWVQDQQANIYRINHQRKHLQFINNAEQQDSWGTKNSIHNIRKDRLGNLYFCTNGRGLFKYNYSKERFNYIGNKYQGPPYKIYTTDNGDIVLSHNQIVYYIDKLKNKLLIETNPSRIFNTESKSSNTMYRDSIGNFIEIANHTTEKFKTRWTYYNTVKDNNTIWTFKNFDWQISTTDSFYILAENKISNITITQFDSLKLNGKAKLYRGYLRTHNGTVWVATMDGGLFKYTPELAIWSQYTFKLHENSLPSNNIYSLLLDPNHPDSILWIGTDQGLTQMNIAKDHFKTFNEYTGLTNNVIYGIQSDIYNNIWFSSNQGLSLMNTETYDVRNYNFKDGLQHNEFNIFESAKDQDNIIYFSGMGGLTYFNPEDFYYENENSNIIINGVKIFNENIKYDPIDSIENKNNHLSKPIEYTDQITFAYAERMITLSFALMDMSSPNKNQYRYKLGGVSEEWINLGTKNEVNFTNLAPGNYDFYVQGANHDGIWSKETDSMKLIILGPWWQNKWLQALALLLFISGIILFFKNREKQKSELHNLRNRISRDLHDEIGSTLSSIALYSEVAKKHNDTHNENLDHMLQQISDNSCEVIESMNDIIWTINSNNDKIEDVINRMRAFANEITEAAGIELKFEVHKSNSASKIDMIHRRNIYLIFKEALNNAIKHSGGTTINVMINIQNNNYFMEIIDNGKGISSQSNKDQWTLSGNGIQNMKTRAEEINAKINMESTPDIGTKISLICRLD